MCFLVLVGAIWLGIITACREIVKEKAIVEREVAVGVRFDAYLLAKCAVLFPLVAVQVILSTVYLRYHFLGDILAAVLLTSLVYAAHHGLDRLFRRGAGGASAAGADGALRCPR